MDTRDVSSSSSTTTNQHEPTPSKHHPSSNHPRDAYDTSGTSPSVPINQQSAAASTSETPAEAQPTNPSHGIPAIVNPTFDDLQTQPTGQWSQGVSRG